MGLPTRAFAIVQSRGWREQPKFTPFAEEHVPGAFDSRHSQGVMACGYASRMLVGTTLTWQSVHVTSYGCYTDEPGSEEKLDLDLEASRKSRENLCTDVNSLLAVPCDMYRQKKSSFPC